MSPARTADTGRVSRSLGIPLLLVSLLVGGYLTMQQLKTEGPTSPAITQAETQAEANVAGVNFQAADAAMQAWLADHGTYEGATLDPSYQVTVVRGDTTSYCIQTAVTTAVEHEDGPGGQPQPGAC
jgi:hypothetical protein